MFSKIVSVISLLFFVANAAKYKVRDGNLRKLAKDVKVKAVSKVKAHLQAFKENVKVKKLGKALTEAKNLKTWNNYDSNFDQKYWINSNAYTSADCSGKPVQQFDEYNSYCYVGTFEGSNSETYRSAQELFNSDCTQMIIGFYTNSDCSGIPAAQGNTASTDHVTTCEAMSFDDDRFIFISEAMPFDDDRSNSFDVRKDILSVQSTCSGSATSWTGGDAVKISNFEQTTTCSGDAQGYYYILGGCYEIDGESIEYMSGPSFAIYSSKDCTGSAITVIPESCEVHPENDEYTPDDDLFDYYEEYDDYYEEYDDLLDDAMFTGYTFNQDVSYTYSWTGASDNMCEKGMYRINGMCNLCPAGFYSDGMESCTMCDEGTYAPYFSSKCYDCPPGTYAVNKGSTECHLCPVNTYPNSQKSKCLPCPEGQMAAPGSFQCHPCDGPVSV